MFNKVFYSNVCYNEKKALFDKILLMFYHIAFYTIIAIF